MSEISYDEDDYQYEDGSDDLEMTQADDVQDDVDDDGMDFDVVPEAQKVKDYDIEYKPMPVAAVQVAMRADVEYIVSICALSADTAQMLLRDYGWNKERLLEKYMDNPTTVLVSAGIERAEPPSSASSKISSPVRRTSRRTTGPTASQVPPASFVCSICCDDSAPAPLALHCGHLFCADCWSTYLSGKIKEEGECTIRCMDTSCSLLVPNTFVREHADKKTFERFEELILRHYVAHIAHLKFCPAPGCTDTVACRAAATKSALSTVVPTVKCTQGHYFCFGCHIDSDHRPVLCQVAKLWLKKCQDDSETANWIKTNTKECTKCQSTIEKNGGCNHMTCKKCKHEFCWVCMGPWSEHGTQWYNCNRYDEKTAIDARDAQSKSRISLERYLHYYNRWANHEQSARLSADLYVKTERKMEEMQITSELTWIEVQFAKKAVEEVLKCRATLKWTYAMAYYLEKSNEKDLFEDNQRDLEKAVEDLSELLESVIETESIPTLRQKMTDKTVYVHRRNEIMLDDTARGFREGRWSWNVAID